MHTPKNIGALLTTAIIIQDREHDIGVSGVDLTANSKQHEVKDTDVAEGTASLGRAAQPPPSEKSSTLDAKDSKVSLYKTGCTQLLVPGQIWVLRASIYQSMGHRAMKPIFRPMHVICVIIGSHCKIYLYEV